MGNLPFEDRIYNGSRPLPDHAISIDRPERYSGAPECEAKRSENAGCLAYPQFGEWRRDAGFGFPACQANAAFSPLRARSPSQVVVENQCRTPTCEGRTYNASELLITSLLGTSRFEQTP